MVTGAESKSELGGASCGGGICLAASNRGPWAETMLVVCDLGGDNACRNQLLVVCDFLGAVGGTMAVTLGMGGLVTWRRGCYNDRYIHSAENHDFSLSLPGCHP